MESIEKFSSDLSKKMITEEAAGSFQGEVKRDEVFLNLLR